MSFPKKWWHQKNWGKIDSSGVLTTDEIIELLETKQAAKAADEKQKQERKRIRLENKK